MVIDLQKLVKENKKLKEKKSLEMSKKSFLNKPAVVKDIIKKSNVSVRASSFNSPVENIFDDENRFFKGEMAKEKKAMFFS